MGRFRRRLCCGYLESDTTLSQNVLAPNPPSQPPPTSSAGASSNNNNAPSAGEHFDEKIDREVLKKLLRDIDEEISRQETSRGSDRKAKALDLIAGNVKDIDDLFNKFAGSCKAIPFTDVAKESRKVLVDVLQGLGSLHWAATGFSMIAFVLNRLHEVGSNFDTCVGILKVLRDLGRHVVDLDERLRDKDGKLEEATALISKGAILCCAHLNWSSFKRFALTDVSKSNFEALRNEVQLLYPDLVLSVLIQQSSFPLATQEHEDPPEHKIALEEKVEEVLQLLGKLDERTLESGVQAVTLHGMGGIGKSTLGNAVCEKLPFTGRSFVKVEIGLVLDDDKILQRQQDLLERLRGQKQRIGNCAEGQRKLTTYLRECKDPVLLFIDNIVHESDLTKLLPKQKFSEIFPDQSRIIVTSRDERMSEFFTDRGIKSETYPVRTLEYPHAKEYFRRQMFVDQEVPRGREQLVHQVLKSCDGLPLALEVTSGYLRRHINDMRAWSTVISSLKNMTELDGTKEDKLVKSLSFSYDHLSEDNKVAFLDIVGLFRNFKWERVESMYGKELADLKSLALVKRVDPKSADHVGVHDLIVALGQRKQPSPTSRIRVDIQDFLPKHLPADHEGSSGNVEGLVVRCMGGFIPAKTLDAMSGSLRILILEDVAVRGKCRKSPRCLRVCSTTKSFPFEDVADLKQLRVLKVSQKSDMNLDNVELPSHLEVLHLIEFDKLQHLPAALGELSSLHTLRLNRCSNLQDLPKNLGQLGCLNTLVISQCKKLRALPEDLKGLHSLQILELHSCEQLRKIPPSFKNLVNLRTLKITDCPLLSRLPDEVLHLQSLQVLELMSSEQSDFQTFENLTVLQTLTLTAYHLLTKLPDRFSHLSSLQFLDLSFCTQLQALPDDFPRLTQLKSLNLSGCTQLQALPVDFPRLTQLKSLQMTRCSQLQELPSGFWNLVALENLKLDQCKNLKSLPPDFPTERPITRLKLLDLSGCPLLEELPEGFGGLITLEELRFEDCEGLTKLPHDFFDLTHLRVLSFISCKQLQRLPNGLGGLVDLEYLDLSYCERLTELPYNFSHLKHLRRLTLWGCVKLLELPQGLENLDRNLRELDIGDSGIVNIPSEVREKLNSVISERIWGASLSLFE